MKRGLVTPSRRVLVLALCAGLAASLLPTAVATVLAQEATTVIDAFEIEGDAASADQLITWTVAEPPGQWSIETRGASEERVSVALLTAEMDPIDDSWGWGWTGLFDLALLPGSYVIRVTASPREMAPYGLRATRQTETFDPEPNDSSEQAVPLEGGAVVQGRLARTSSDVDRYRVSVPPGSTDLRDIRLEWSADIGRQLCLLDAEERELTCRAGTRNSCVNRLASLA